MQDFMGFYHLQELQDKFCQATNLFAYCVDGTGEKVSEISGPASDLLKVEQILEEDTVYDLFQRLCESTLEDQIIEETKYSNVKVAAVAYKREGKPILCWLACCVTTGENPVEGKALLKDTTCQISEEQFEEYLDFVRLIVESVMKIHFSLLDVSEKVKQTSFSASNLEKNLKKAKALTEAVQMLESEKPFESICNELLCIVGEYLNISSTQLLQLTKDRQHVDVLGEWINEGITSLFDQTKDIPRSVVVQSEKPLIISRNTIVSKEARIFLDSVHDKAFISIPLTANNQVVMYWCINECKEERIWTIEEVHFISDVAKVLQSVLTRRIQKNSLASSFASMKSILDNVGSAIYVKDFTTKELLFANKVLKKSFAKELTEGNLEQVLSNDEISSVELINLEGYHEVINVNTGKWYDFYMNQIEWVDGRTVALCSLFDITDKKLYQRKIEQQAYTDFLTGLYNRMCCERDLACEVDLAKQKNQTGGLLYLDLDDFKHINDGLGHQYGDALLRSISTCLSNIKGIEKSCYRMGGDEFVIMVTPEHYPRFDQILQEIKEIFAKPWFLKNTDYYCTMSMGIVTFPDEGENVQELIKKADIAMYEAKKSGKNRHARYSDNLTSVSYKRLDMEKNMRVATTEGYKEFEVYYQPIIDVRNNKTICTGAEALIRWNSTALGFIPPSEFIPLAEYLGLINPIGNYVLKEACMACKGWNDKGKDYFKVNVNLSVVQLMQNDIVDIIKDTLEETGINPQNLTLEVTESLAINDMERMIGILNKIRSLDVRIALDDFGTGYSSLNHIRELPLDVIKVDKNFVQGLEYDNYSKSFIRMVGELADAINVNVCLEGVETVEQFKSLEGMEVQLIQGYFFDKPMKKVQFEEKYVS